MILRSPGHVDARTATAHGPLAPLASSLAADLDRWLPGEDVRLPDEKARLSRHGGRCLRDGLLLEFDPGSPRRHRCPRCGKVYDGEAHYRWWIMGYQLWLAERAVHAALLARLGGPPRFRRLAEGILDRQADRYLDYPNADNVLGPTRVFFSTYLESIWLLQVAVALSLLEDGATPGALGGRVRDRVIEPSSDLIRTFNEGDSNRQVWNAAALAAAGLVLGRAGLVNLGFDGPGGLRHQLSRNLFEDGSWYEGENYHLFAHRGLWYLVAMAEANGVSVDAPLVARFDRGFASPLRTALPDFTFPARRDSQYGVSLRQWRIAESLELGLARNPDAPELAAGLRTLYAGGEQGDPARWRSTAEAERNVPGVRLTRADLGWKSLLFAREAVPPAPSEGAGPVLLPDQGFAIVRRDGGKTWAALDYGASGGSHGHPDRLNFWLVLGDRRVFEDVGTGSYVDPSLHWYRSTLAHNAPLVDGASQPPTHGRLRAWDVKEPAAWVVAEADVAPGVRATRTLVVAEGHVVDQVEWRASRPVRFSLPMHLDAEVQEAAWASADARGGGGLEDGFSFVSDVSAAPGLATVHLSAPGIHGVVHCQAASDWMRFRGPGPPGEPARRFLMVSESGTRGAVTSVWSWHGPVDLAWRPGGEFDVIIAGRRTTHRPAPGHWLVEAEDTVTDLDGRREAGPPGPVVAAPSPIAPVHLPVLAQAPATLGGLSESREPVLRVALGEAHYRRTEASWREAGAPTALVVVGATAAELLVEVTVSGRAANLASRVDENPLDNEHPDTNSDGVQIHLRFETARGRAGASWLLVPEPGGNRVRVSGRDLALRCPITASWRPTADGWQLLARVPRGSPPGSPTGIDVIVNEMPPGRERRRGQLVLSGAHGEWAYLRGDRQDLDRLVPVVVRDE